MISTAMRILALAVALAGLWVARPFLLQITFAIILAIAVWPLYRRLSLRATNSERSVFLPLLFTVVVGAILILPFVVFASEAIRDGSRLAEWLMQATRSGIPPPQSLRAVPIAGPWLIAWWMRHLAEPDSAAVLLRQINVQWMLGALRTLIGSTLSWAMFILVTLLTLFICLRNGSKGAAAACRIAHRLYGPFGERLVTRYAEAIRDTVNGTLFVSFGEGLLIGGAYALTGLPHAIAFTTVTIGLALISFGAWVAFGLAALFLVVQGHAVMGAVLFASGAAVMLIGDNLVQPAVIGESIRLPFLWTFVGLFGGMYSFGLVGLFIGPAVMSAVFLLWTEWERADVPSI